MAGFRSLALLEAGGIGGGTATLSRTASLGAAVLHAASAAASASAAVQAAGTAAALASAAIQAARSSSAAADAAVQAPVSLGAGLSAYVLAPAAGAFCSLVLLELGGAGAEEVLPPIVPQYDHGIPPGWLADNGFAALYAQPAPGIPLANRDAGTGATQSVSATLGSVVLAAQAAAAGLQASVQAARSASLSAGAYVQAAFTLAGLVGAAVQVRQQATARASAAVALPGVVAARCNAFVYNAADYTRAPAGDGYKPEPVSRRRPRSTVPKRFSR